MEMQGASAIPVLAEWLWLPADDQEVARRVRQFTAMPRALGARYSFSDGKSRKPVIALDHPRP